MKTLPCAIVMCFLYVKGRMIENISPRAEWKDRKVHTCPPNLQKILAEERRGGRRWGQGQLAEEGQKQRCQPLENFSIEGTYQWQTDSHMLAPTYNSNGIVRDPLLGETFPDCPVSLHHITPFSLSTQHLLSGIVFVQFFCLHLLSSTPSILKCPLCSLKVNDLVSWIVCFLSMEYMPEGCRDFVNIHIAQSTLHVEGAFNTSVNTCIKESQKKTLAHLPRLHCDEGLKFSLSWDNGRYIASVTGIASTFRTTGANGKDGTRSVSSMLNMGVAKTPQEQKTAPFPLQRARRKIYRRHSLQWKHAESIK